MERTSHPVTEPLLRSMQAAPGRPRGQARAASLAPATARAAGPRRPATARDGPTTLTR